MPPTQIGNIAATQGTASAQRVIPLLQALGRTEEMISALVLRLDPITNHVPMNEATTQNPSTVTGRITLLGDALQYLLDNIEL